MDIVDEAGQVIEMIQQRREDIIRRAAQTMPKGEPGDCDECGLKSKRLVQGVCAPCRDLLAEIKRRG